jgi:hypothetical protein
MRYNRQSIAHVGRWQSDTAAGARRTRSIARRQPLRSDTAPSSSNRCRIHVDRSICVTLIRLFVSVMLANAHTSRFVRNEPRTHRLSLSRRQRGVGTRAGRASARPEVSDSINYHRIVVSEGSRSASLGHRRRLAGGGSSIVVINLLTSHIRFCVILVTESRCLQSIIPLTRSRTRIDHVVAHSLGRHARCTQASVAGALRRRRRRLTARRNNQTSIDHFNHYRISCVLFFKLCSFVFDVINGLAHDV